MSKKNNYNQVLNQKLIEKEQEKEQQDVVESVEEIIEEIVEEIIDESIIESIDDVVEEPVEVKSEGLVYGEDYVDNNSERILFEEPSFELKPIEVKPLRKLEDLSSFELRVYQRTGIIPQ